MGSRTVSRRSTVALLAAAGVLEVGRCGIGWLAPDGERRDLEALLRTMLPDELLGGAVDRCLAWVDASRWSAGYRADLGGLDVTARERFGLAFAACDLDQRT